MYVFMYVLMIHSSAPAGKAVADEKLKFNLSLSPKPGKGIDR